MAAYDFNTPVLDAPDPTVRRAALKAQLGIAPTNQELDRLGLRMSLEQQAATGADAPNSALGRANYDFNGRPRAGAPGLLSTLEVAADSARNPAPIAGDAPGVLAMLRGSRLDPLQSRRDERRQRLADQGLALQVSAEQRRQQQDAQRIRQQQVNDAAARAAIAPVTALPAPEAVAQAFASGTEIPQATTREPTGDEILRNYINAGGQAEPSLLVAAAKPPRAQRSVTVIPLQDASGATVNFAWDGANLQRIDAKPEKTVPGAGGIDVIDVPGVGKIAVDAKSRAPIEAGKVIKPPKAGKGLDPMLVGTLAQQIQSLETEKLQHQQAIATGDNRYGFLNISTRKERIAEIDARLSGLRATLGAGGDSAADEPAAAEPAKAAAKPQTAAKPAKGQAAEQWPFYPHQDVQAELKRRGLIK